MKSRDSMRLNSSRSEKFSIVFKPSSVTAVCSKAKMRSPCRPFNCAMPSSVKLGFCSFRTFKSSSFLMCFNAAFVIRRQPLKSSVSRDGMFFRCTSPSSVTVVNSK